MTQLQPGEKRRLSDFVAGPRLRVQVTHDLAQADVSVFGLDGERQLRDDRYFVFYNQLQSPGREVSLRLDAGRATFDLDLSALPATVERLEEERTRLRAQAAALAATLERLDEVVLDARAKLGPA